MMTEQKKNMALNEEDLEKVTGGAGLDEQTRPEEEPDYTSPEIPERKRKKKISEF